MEAKGYLHPGGKVRQTSDGAIAEIYYHERGYNLVRYYVTKEWRVYTLDRSVPSDERLIGKGDTRRDAIANAEAWLDNQPTETEQPT